MRRAGSLTSSKNPSRKRSSSRARINDRAPGPSGTAALPARWSASDEAARALESPLICGHENVGVFTARSERIVSWIAAQAARTDFDGFFLFDRVAYGKYSIRIGAAFFTL